MKSNPRATGYGLWGITIDRSSSQSSSANAHMCSRKAQLTLTITIVALDKIATLEGIINGLPGYRFYASSLLMLYDGAPKSPPSEATTSPPASTLRLKLVDFANCASTEDWHNAIVPSPPHRPEGIDRGYLRGLRSLRMYLTRILKEAWSESGRSADEVKAMVADVPAAWRESEWEGEDEGGVSI